MRWREEAVARAWLRAGFASHADASWIDIALSEFTKKFIGRDVMLHALCCVVSYFLAANGFRRYKIILDVYNIIYYTSKIALQETKPEAKNSPRTR